MPRRPRKRAADAAGSGNDGGTLVEGKNMKKSKPETEAPAHFHAGTTVK